MAATVPKKRAHKSTPIIFHSNAQHNAIGGSTQGATRVHAPKRSVSVHEILGNSEMKLRAPVEQEREHLKRRLEEREEQEQGAKRSVASTPAEALAWLEEFDPDREKKKEVKKEEDEKREGSSDESDSSSEESEEEEELRRELEKIRRERAEEAALRERAAQEEEKMARREAVAGSNPLLAPATQTVGKKWYEDTVFRNQAKTQTKEPKRFVNDTIRSDFHRKFLDRFIK